MKIEITIDLSEATIQRLAAIIAETLAQGRDKAFGKVVRNGAPESNSSALGDEAVKVA